MVRGRAAPLAQSSRGGPERIAPLGGGPPRMRGEYATAELELKNELGEREGQGLGRPGMGKKMN